MECQKQNSLCEFKDKNELKQFTNPIWETSPSPTPQKQVDPPDKMIIYLNEYMSKCKSYSCTFNLIDNMK